MRPSVYLSLETHRTEESSQALRPGDLQIPIDEEGLNTEKLTAPMETLRKQGKGALFLYTIPHFKIQAE